MTAHPPVRCAADCTLAAEASAALHHLAQAVVADDIDRAIALGLLGYVSPVAAADASAQNDDPRGDAPPQRLCAHCLDNDCLVTRARDARLRALAARERHRAREARLRRRAEARANRRTAIASSAPTAVPASEAKGSAATASVPPAASSVPTTRSALPPAAAAALARAKAKAAARGAKD